LSPSFCISYWVEKGKAAETTTADANPAVRGIFYFVIAREPLAVLSLSKDGDLKQLELSPNSEVERSL